MINKAIIIGNMTKDPELKNLPAGTAVANFGVATNEKWNDKATGEKREKVEYHNIVVFGKQAENVSRFTSKGSKVYVEGKLQTRSWEDKEGNKRYTTEILANDVKFLSNNKEVNNALKEAGNKQQDFEVSTNANFAGEDIPF